MPDYSKSKIYAIKNDELMLVYIGATTQSLGRRFGQHKSNYILQNKQSTSIECFKEGKPYYCLIEKFPCENKLNLNQRERYFIEHNPFPDYKLVNCVVPLRTQQEYYQANKKLLNMRRRLYYYKNHKLEKEKAKVYYYKNKDSILKKVTCEICDGTYDRAHKARHFKSQKHIEAMNKEEFLLNIEN